MAAAADAHDDDEDDDDDEEEALQEQLSHQKRGHQLPSRKTRGKWCCCYYVLIVDFEFFISG